jgi:hypothetical protein
MSETKITKPERLPAIEGKIELGDRVQDKITGLGGIVVGRSEWLYGCERLIVQPEEVTDGKPAESFSLDEPQADLVAKAAVANQAKSGKHGDRPEVPRVNRHATR